MKKNYRLSIYFIFLILFVCFHACKKDEKYKDTLNSSRINNLQVDNKIQPQEILDWFSTFSYGSQIQPKWNDVTQITINGQQVIEIPIEKGLSLFFTKTNGKLNVSAYKWLDKMPGAPTFTGDVAIFSFQDQSLTGSIYSKGKLVKSNIFNCAEAKRSPQKNSSTQLSMTEVSSTDDIIGAILCWMTGGKWTGYKTNWCNYSESIWVKIATFLDSIFGGDNNDGEETVGSEDGDGTSIDDGGFGDSFSGSYGTSDGGSVSISYGGAGASVYMTVNPPCSVDGGGATPISTIDDGSGGPCGGATTQVISYPVDAFDTYTGDEPDEADDDANIVSPHIPLAHIPTTITLTNGQTVSVIFGTTADGQSADQQVSSRLIATLTQALNIASQTVTITSIYIKATTNGVHSSPSSNHYKGLALDISRINGVPMSVSGNTAFVQALQSAFDQSANIRENFGPYFKHKLGQPFTVSGHSDHIHVSVNGN